LEARLEALAGASERSLTGADRYDRHIQEVKAATRHAVALELISSDEAGAVWAAVAQRHPRAGWCRIGPGIAA
jgi:hypothetical protein